MNVEQYISSIFSMAEKEDKEAGFKALALEAFEFQREHCPVYRNYLDLIGKGDLHPKELEEIPFLPIRLFKSCNILTDPLVKNPEPQSGSYHGTGIVFTSSATTGMVPSHHIVADVGVYEKSFKEAFRMFYGESGTYNLLALLPSYLERKGSSLIYMADRLIQDTRAKGAAGGFFLYDHQNLLDTITSLNVKDSDTSAPASKTVLLGVSFALLDFAEFVKAGIPDAKERKAIFSNVVVMETGGMKGRGQELSREVLHSILSDAFCTPSIHSEYGMCELLSQAYSTSCDGLFVSPPWMRALVRDLHDPFRVIDAQSKDCGYKASGALNIIDLANIHSCCFIETEDRGTVCCTDNTLKFSVDGRISNAELRGCNMLIE